MQDCRQVFLNNGRNNSELAEHFHTGHNMEEDLDITIVQKDLSSTSKREHMENRWMCKLQTRHGTGLNISTVALIRGNTVTHEKNFQQKEAVFQACLSFKQTKEIKEALIIRTLVGRYMHFSQKALPPDFENFVGLYLPKYTLL